MMKYKSAIDKVESLGGGKIRGVIAKENTEQLII